MSAAAYLASFSSSPLALRGVRLSYQLVQLVGAGHRPALAWLILKEINSRIALQHSNCLLKICMTRDDTDKGMRCSQPNVINCKSFCPQQAFGSRQLSESWGELKSHALNAESLCVSVS